MLLRASRRQWERCRSGLPATSLDPDKYHSAAGWRLVVEEVLQLGEPVAKLAPAAAPGMLLAGVGSGLAAYRLVPRAVPD